MAAYIREKKKRGHVMFWFHDVTCQRLFAPHQVLCMQEAKKTSSAVTRWLIDCGIFARFIWPREDHQLMLIGRQKMSMLETRLTLDRKWVVVLIGNGINKAPVDDGQLTVKGKKLITDRGAAHCDRFRPIRPN